MGGGGGAGMGLEDTQMIVEGMAQAGAEPTYCMGDDTPLPVLSDKPHMLYDYFKQRFAQVRTTSCALFLGTLILATWTVSVKTVRQ